MHTLRVVVIFLAMTAVVTLSFAQKGLSIHQPTLTP